MNTEEAIKTAELYTANKAAAKQIAECLPDGDPAQIRSACLAWIREREDLFEEMPPYTEGAAIPAEIRDMGAFCRSLSYEERIVVLMKHTEGCTEEQIAEELGLTAEQVLALLQSAKAKNPDPLLKEETEKPAAPKEKGKTKRDARVKTEKHAKKPVLSNKVVITIAAVIVVILGSLLGVRSYAARQFRLGRQLLEQAEYSQAAEALENAIQWNGGGKEAVLLLGDAYCGMAEYDKAVSRYEEYIRKAPNENINDRFVSMYRKAAYKALDEGDSTAAVNWLEREYGLIHDERTFYRKEAIRAGGTYTDVSGNIYNIYGNPVRLVSKEMTLTLTYDGEKLTKIQGTPTGRKINTVLNLPDTEETHTWQIHWYPADRTSVAYIAEDSAWKNGNLASRTFRKTGEKDLVYRYAYEVREDRVTGWNETCPDGTAAKVTCTYDGNGHLSMTETELSDGSASLRTTYDYDRDGNLIQTAVTRSIIDLQEKHTWTYTNGIPSEEILDRKASYTRYPEEVMRSYRRIVYKNSTGGDHLTAVLKDRDGRDRALGYFIPGTGWIWMYTENDLQ